MNEKYSIGDIRINVEKHDRIKLMSNWNAFLDFNSRKININISLNPNKIIKYNKKDWELVFQSSNWRLYKKLHDYLIVVGNRNNEHMTAEYNLSGNGNTIFVEINCSLNSVNSFYPIDELIIIHLLSYKKGIVFHSASITKNKLGYSFLGSSGSGKSTLSKLFEISGINVLSDDRAIIRGKNNKIFAFGTPWHGDANLFSNENAPLMKIFFIKHSHKNMLKPIDPAKAAAILVTHSFSPFWDKKSMQKILELCIDIAKKIPCYEFSFVPNISAVNYVMKFNQTS